MKTEIRDLLEEKYDEYNRPGFIVDDPISIPHQFDNQQDREISGFFSAVLAWGQRKTIIRNAERLMDLMGREPYQFILHHTSEDLLPLEGFVHRAFQSTDLLYFIRFLKNHYSTNNSLETAFLKGETMQEKLTQFEKYFFSLTDYPSRTRKHISSPARNSSCKRLNMFLRWMVRKDERGVDFGMWKKISPTVLICPLDVHTGRISRLLKILNRRQDDWKAACELTGQLRTLDARDPVRFDYALFGLGLELRRKLV